MFLSILFGVVGVFVFPEALAAPQVLAEPARIERVALPEIGSDARDNYHLEVTLGRLGRGDFDAYVAAFKTRGLVHDSRKEYALADFLPPFAQALLRAFVPVTTMAGPSPEFLARVRELVAAEEGLMEDESVFHSANCHSLTWQWMLFWQNPGGPGRNTAFIFNADRGAISMLTNPYDEPGVRLSLVEVPREQLRVGDLLLVQGAAGLRDQDMETEQHSAVYVGHGLILEKGNTNAAYPYRVVKLDDSLALYRERLTHGGRARFFRVTTEPVRGIYETFSAAATYPDAGFFTQHPEYMLKSELFHAQDYYFLGLIVEARLERDERTGRYRLPAEVETRYGLSRF